MSEEGEKKQAVAILGVMILFVIFFAIVFYFKEAKESGIQDFKKVEYNHFEFVHYKGHWYTEWQRGENVYQIPLRFNPYEVEDVPITGRLDNDFALEKEVYITFDATMENLTFIALGAAELSQNVAKALGIKPVAACTNNESIDCADRPIIECGNDLNKSIISLHPADTVKVELEGNCVKLQGPEMSLLKSVDRFLYQWYGIMK